MYLCIDFVIGLRNVSIHAMFSTVLQAMVSQVFISPPILAQNRILAEYGGSEYFRFCKTNHDHLGLANLLISQSFQNHIY